MYSQAAASAQTPIEKSAIWRPPKLDQLEGWSKQPSPGSSLTFFDSHGCSINANQKSKWLDKTPTYVHDKLPENGKFESSKFSTARALAAHNINNTAWATCTYIGKYGPNLLK